MLMDGVFYIGASFWCLVFFFKMWSDRMDEREASRRRFIPVPRRKS